MIFKSSSVLLLAAVRAMAPVNDNCAQQFPNEMSECLDGCNDAFMNCRSECGTDQDCSKYCVRDYDACEYSCPCYGGCSNGCPCDSFCPAAPGCGGQPCQNGGTCQPLGDTEYICHCNEFYWGDKCENEV